MVGIIMRQIGHLSLGTISSVRMSARALLCCCVAFWCGESILSVGECELVYMVLVVSDQSVESPF